MLPYLINLGDSTLFSKGTPINAEGVILSGEYPLCSPTSLWHKGATYVMGYKGDATNTSVIFKYQDGNVEMVEVYTPTIGDALSHQFPVIYIENDFIYVFQINGHGSSFKMLKSNSPNSIIDGFSERFSSAYTRFGYCNPQGFVDGTMIMVSRITGGSVNLYGQVVYLNLQGIEVDAAWQARIITDPNYSSTSIRHYPSTPAYYGTNQWKYVGINLRNDNTEIPTYFAHALYKTKDFKTIYNLSETFSKDIVTNGFITAAELESHYTEIGTTNQTEIMVNGLNFIVIADIVYSSYYNQAEGIFKFIKIKSSGVKTEYPVPFDMAEPNSASITHLFITYNGVNLVIQAIENGKRTIHACDLGFTNFKYMATIRDVENDLPDQVIDRPVLPQNLNEISGNYLIAGTDIDGIFPFIETNDKFFI